MTRTHLGPNGEQQRVTVERDFRNETELNAFLREFEENLHKTTGHSKYTAGGHQQQQQHYHHHSSGSSSAKTNHSSTSDDLTKSPG